MDKIKCLIIWGGQLNASGVPNVLFNIIKELHNKVDFDVVVAEGDNPKADEFMKLGVNIKYINDQKPNYSGVKYKIWYYIFRTIRLKKQMLEVIKPEYNCVYCVSGPLSGVYLEIANKKGINTRIVHCHGKVSSNVSILRKIQLFFFLRKIEDNATCKLTCSKEAGRTLFPNTAGMITLVNGIELQQYPLIPKQQSRIIRLLQIGYYNPIKNQKFSLNVLHEIKKLGMPCELTFIGYESSHGYFEEMQDFISDKGLKENVRFLPSDYDKNIAFSNCDILILPSLSEACPLVALEAQAGYVPVCASEFVPTDIDFGLCEFMQGWNVEEWAQQLVIMKSKTYTRNSAFADIDLPKYSDNIYRLICGRRLGDKD